MRHSPGQVQLWACLKKKKSYFTLRLCESQIYSSDVYYFINIYTQMCTCIYSMQHFSSVTEPTHLTTGHLGTPLNITSMLEENTAIQAGSEQASWAWQCINAFFKALTCLWVWAHGKCLQSLWRKPGSLLVGCAVQQQQKLSASVHIAAPDGTNTPTLYPVQHRHGPVLIKVKHILSPQVKTSDF